MKKFIINLTKKTGLEVLKRFHSDKTFKIKSKSQIVTATDFLADRIIVSALKKKFPGHKILSEESGANQKKSDYLWVVDPIDGTTNYSIGSPLFAVQLALFYKNQPVISCAYAPALDELYFAEKGKGFYLNNKKMRVSDTADLEKSFFLFCHGSKQKDIKRAMKIYSQAKLKTLDSRQLGTAALETGFVACGRTDCIVIPGANVWDVGPGVLFIREAGGKVTDFSGKGWNLNSYDLVASNGKIHSQLLKLLKNK